MKEEIMPQDIHSLHEKASEAMSEGEREKAIELYNEILEYEPGDEIAHGQLMDLYFDTDKFRYYLTRANYNVVNQKFEHAINDTKKALAMDANSVEARVKLARLYRVSKKNLKAIDEFNKLIEIEPKLRESYIELINLYTVEDAIESAVGIARKAVEEFPDDTELKNVLAKLYYDTGSYSKALDVVQDRFLKTKILLSDNQNEEAKKVLDEINPSALNEKTDKAAYNLLLAEYFYNKNEYENALNVINDYVNIMGPDAVSFQMKALCFEGMDDEFSASVNFGYMKKAQGKNDEAIVEFNHAHGLNKKDKNVLIELASLYMQLGEKYTAMDFWNEIYKLDGDPHAKEVLGEFYFNEGDYLTAEKYGKVREDKNSLSPSGNEYSYTEASEQDEGLIEKIIGFFTRKQP